MKKKKFIPLNSKTLFMEYRLLEKTLTIYLKENIEFTGKIRWVDSYAIKLALENIRETVIIPIHNVLYYKSENLILKDEQEELDAYRAPPNISGLEKKQLKKYCFRKTPVHFYLKGGIEIKGRLKKFYEHAYVVNVDDEAQEYYLTKRHILYYKKIRY